MKLTAFVLLALTVSAFAEIQSDAVWSSFKSLHGKTYQNQVEETKRYAIFKDNLRQIEEHNAKFEQGLTTYKQGINKFTDMTKDEFVAMLNSQLSTKPIKSGNRTLFKSSVKAPESIDWRDSNVVTPVKDQGTCGSCWAFSATGATEAAYALKNGTLVSFSEQQIVDCTKVKPYKQLGCYGGLMEAAFDYIKDSGIQSEESYPYEGVDNDCRATGEYVTKVTGYVDVAEFEEGDLVTAVGTIGPISVAIDASNLSPYASGIYDGSCSPYSLDHGVLAVGYATTENGQDYWLVKNSWGSSWGEEGYFKLKRGENHCGIAVEPSYPTL